MGIYRSSPTWCLFLIYSYFSCFYASLALRNIVLSFSEVHVSRTIVSRGITNYLCGLFLHLQVSNYWWCPSTDFLLYFSWWAAYFLAKWELETNQGGKPKNYSCRLHSKQTEWFLVCFIILREWYINSWKIVHTYCMWPLSRAPAHTDSLGFSYTV